MLESTTEMISRISPIVDIVYSRWLATVLKVEDAKDTVTMNEAEEFSQMHIDEMITSTREIDDAEYLRVFNEDNDYLREWTEKINYLLNS